MKQCVLAAVAAVCASAVQAAPQVSGVSMSQDSATRKVTIEYVLSDEDAVITVDIQTNAVPDAAEGWTSIGAENLNGFVGDVNCKLAPSTEKRTILWNPDTYWPNQKLPAKATRAVVTAWATNAPPDWLVCELTAPYAVRYYEHACQVPDGVTAKKYKRTHLLFRKIHAKGVEWTMGAGSSVAKEKPHKVTLTEDYYMGVYQLTKEQSGLTSIYPAGAVDGSTPLNNLRFTDMRGSTKGSQWPSFTDDGSLDFWKSHEVDSGSIIASFRNKCKMLVDLPTEAQWEYAARAGETRLTFGDGTDTVNNIKNYGRFAGDKGKADCEGYAGNFASVGSYLPNDFGLYDVIGNVTEECLDWYASFENIDTEKIHVDPVGSASGTSRLTKGGSYYYETGGSLAGRVAQEPGSTWAVIGFRLSIPLH